MHNEIPRHAYQGNSKTSALLIILHYVSFVNRAAQAAASYL